MRMWCKLTATVEVDMAALQPSAEPHITSALLNVPGIQIVDALTLQLDDTRNLLEDK